MNKATLTAIACLIIGGLIGSVLTYQFSHCKSEVIFQIKSPATPQD